MESSDKQAYHKIQLQHYQSAFKHEPSSSFPFDSYLGTSCVKRPGPPIAPTEAELRAMAA